jgi:hypothetical protein
MLRPTRAKHHASLQSRNTPSKDAPPQPADDEPPSKPREWLTPPFKEGFVASNDKPFVKKGDTATTSMVNREALTGPSSVCLASCTAGVGSGALVASLSSRTNASPSTLPKAFPAGAEETSVGVAVARNESKTPRQKRASPAKRRSARLLPVRLPTRGATSPLESGFSGGCPWSRRRAGSCPGPLRGGLLAHATIAPYPPKKGSASLKCSISYDSLRELPRIPKRRSSQNSNSTHLGE